MNRVTLNVDLNRVEGDLELQVELEGHTIVDARCIGTMYRGFEQILIGRMPTDALVITPRVCGICSTAHLYAAVLALEQLAGVQAPEHAVLIRNLCLLAETVQSDLRQTFLFFTPDFCHPRYAQHAMAPELQEAFANLDGSVARGCLQTSRELLGVVALFGGQWPHSSWMLPGGVSSPANPRRLVNCQSIIGKATRWFEKSVLGGSLPEWLALDSADGLWRWLDAKKQHQSAALGLFSRFARDIGLQHIGLGSRHMISYGIAGSEASDGVRWPAGFFNGDDGTVSALDHLQINEHVRHSWFLPYEGGKHPWSGETIPDYQQGRGRYTWAKAPRYGDLVVQTGPLAELTVAGDALVTDLLAKEGDNTWLRQFARLRRAAWALQSMSELTKTLATRMDEPHISPPNITTWPDGESYGLVEAARGALGHWLKVKNSVIEKYQIITPTGWNASPRDSEGRSGHWEQSLVGITLQNPDDPIEIGHVVRSHDPCMVCTVHFVGDAKKLHFGL